MSMDEISRSDIRKVNFLRNEANLERRTIENQQAFLQGYETRRSNFQEIRPDAPDPKLIDIKIGEISTEIDRTQANIGYSAKMLQSHARQLGNLIDGKVRPKDLIEATEIDIGEHNRFLQSGGHRFLGQKGLGGN